MLSLSQSLFEDGGAYIELGAKNEGNELLYIINVPTDNFFGILSKLCEDLRLSTCTGIVRAGFMNAPTPS